MVDVGTGLELVSALRSQPQGPVNLTILCTSGSLFNISEAPRAPPLSYFDSGVVTISGGLAEQPTLVDLHFLSEGTVSRI